MVTVQARLPGVGADRVRLRAGRRALVVDVLAALAEVEVHADMAVLPVPDGEPPFDPAVPFTTVAGRPGRAPRRAAGRPRRPQPSSTASSADLRGLAPAPPALVHGDLGVGNLLVADGRPSGLLDFGYVSTVGDAAFDAAVAAALHRMLGRRRCRTGPPRSTP